MSVQFHTDPFGKTFLGQTISSKLVQEEPSGHETMHYRGERIESVINGVSKTNVMSSNKMGLSLL